MDINRQTRCFDVAGSVTKVTERHDTGMHRIPWRPLAGVDDLALVRGDHSSGIMPCPKPSESRQSQGYTGGFKGNHTAMFTFNKFNRFNKSCRKCNVSMCNSLQHKHTQEMIQACNRYIVSAAH